MLKKFRCEIFRNYTVLIFFERVGIITFRKRIRMHVVQNRLTLFTPVICLLANLEFIELFGAAGAMPSPGGKVAERKRGRMRVSLSLITETCCVI